MGLVCLTVLTKRKAGHYEADTADKDLTPESRGLDAIAGGFQKMELSDHEKLEREFPVYDALYVYCGGSLPIPTPAGRV